MRASRTIRTVVTAVGILGLTAMAGPASAETSVFGLRIEGEVELGGRVFLDEPSDKEKGKLEEYRDLSEQPFGAFGVRLFRPDESYTLELGGAKVGQEDQEFFLGAGRPGLWRFHFDWNQIPHVYSTTGRLLATEPSPGVFVLPSPRPPLAAYNAGRELDEISQRWDLGRFSFTLTPTPTTDILVEYTRIKKDGEKPIGVSMGSPGGNFVEVLEPLDQTIHELRIKGSWVGDGWQLQAAYTLSIFDNAVGSVTADNPCFRLPACGGDAAGPERGRISLAPDNMAHTVSLAAGVNLPMRTRVTANLSYSLRLQDDDFLPHTINPAISSPLLALPRQSLDGVVGILLFNLSATARPLPPLTVTARYRLFDFDDMTDELLFPGHVVSDRTLVTDGRIATRFEYTKHNADVSGRWRFDPRLATTLGGGWEYWDRTDHREVETSHEYFARLAVDATPWDWVLARLAYRPSFRRIGDYNTFAHIAHTVVEELDADARAQSQSTLLRKFDEADRDRHRVDLTLQLTPTPVIAVTPAFSYRTDDYYNSRLGLQDAETYSLGFDVTWTPVPWLAVTAGYVYDRIDQQQRSRSREVVGTQVLDFPDFEWVSDNIDIYHTAHAGVRAALIRNVLDWLLEFSYSYGRTEINTVNPIPPRTGTAAQQANATAKPFPDLENTLYRVGTALRYRFARAWYLRLGYLFEKFEQTNFRTETLSPFQAATTSIFLGNDLRDYTAHIVTLAVGYRFN